jgi:hypothetical protein
MNKRRLPLSLNGSFRVEVRWAKAPDPEEDEALRKMLDHFVEAIRLKMFPPAELRSVKSSLGGSDPRVLVREFEASHVPKGIFHVLAGMLRQYEEVYTPLEYQKATLDTDPTNLLEAASELPPPPDQIPFTVDLNPPEGTAPELLVLVEFNQSIPPEARDFYLPPFDVWDTLMQGGYATPDDPLGTSGVGASSTRFDDPYTIHHHLDAWRASWSCFDPLIHLVISWSEKTPVARIEVS